MPQTRHLRPSLVIPHILQNTFRAIVHRTAHRPLCHEYLTPRSHQLEQPGRKEEVNVRLGYFFYPKWLLFWYFPLSLRAITTYDYEPAGKEPDGWKEYVKMQYYENAKMWQYGNVAMWQCSNVATWQCSNMAMWQSNNLTTGAAGKAWHQSINININININMLNMLNIWYKPSPI